MADTTSAVYAAGLHRSAIRHPSGPYPEPSRLPGLSTASPCPAGSGQAQAGVPAHLHATEQASDVANEVAATYPAARAHARSADKT